MEIRKITYETEFGTLPSASALPYPKEYRENMEFRAKILRKAQTDHTFQAKLKELFFRDILFAFNCFFYTLDVRKRPFHNQPFITYPFQDKVILEIQKAIQEGYDLPNEKSRDLGLSWIVILIFQHFWLNPKGGADFLCGSRIEDYVDKHGDMRTILEKFRYALYKLPYWLQPKDFSRKTHDNFMRIMNPETGSAITGESNNPNFSTGGRYAGILLDEFAKWKDTATQAWTAAGDASPSRIPVSSAFGVGGKFYDLTHSSRPKLRLHWTLHPEKAEGAYCRFPRSEEELLFTTEELIRSPWYDAQVERRTSSEIAQELDIKYLGSGSMVFDGKAARRLDRLLRIDRPPIQLLSVDFTYNSLVPIKNARSHEGVLVFWEELQSTQSYTLGVDICEGKGISGDYSIIKVLCRQTKSVVASYYSKIDEIRLALVIFLISSYIEDRSLAAPWVGIETIGPGLSTFDLCVELHEMTNLFMMPKRDNATGNFSVIKGWRTTQSSRNRLISGIKEWLLESEGWVNPRCLGECASFERNKTGRAEARAGTHDDEVIAFGIAIQVDLLVPEDENIEPKKHKVDSLFELREDQFDPMEVISFQTKCLNFALKKQAKRNLEQKDLSLSDRIGLSI